MLINRDLIAMNRDLIMIKLGFNGDYSWWFFWDDIYIYLWFFVDVAVRKYGQHQDWDDVFNDPVLTVFFFVGLPVYHEHLKNDVIHMFNIYNYG